MNQGVPGDGTTFLNGQPTCTEWEAANGIAKDLIGKIWNEKGGVSRDAILPSACDRRRSDTCWNAIGENYQLVGASRRPVIVSVRLLFLSAGPTTRGKKEWLLFFQIFRITTHGRIIK